MGFFFPPPMMTRIPPMSANPMTIATKVPPSIAPAMELMTSNMPGIRLWIPRVMLARTMVRKANSTPPQPSPMIVLASFALKAEPTPPNSRVAPAANTLKIPAIRAMIPPAFFMRSTQ